MSSHLRESGEPNLVPILDMVFQLITFFMLVINFKTAELDTSLKLPVVGSARPLDTNGQDSLLVLNIDAEGRLHIFGEEHDLKTYVTDAARRAKVIRDANKNAEQEESLVVLRVDRATPYRLLQEVFDTCRENGYSRFTLKVVTASEDRT